MSWRNRDPGSRRHFSRHHDLFGVENGLCQVDALEIGRVCGTTGGTDCIDDTSPCIECVDTRTTHRSGDVHAEPTRNSRARGRWNVGGRRDHRLGHGHDRQLHLDRNCRRAQQPPAGKTSNNHPDHPGKDASRPQEPRPMSKVDPDRPAEPVIGISETTGDAFDKRTCELIHASMWMLRARDGTRTS